MELVGPAVPKKTSPLNIQDFDLPGLRDTIRVGIQVSIKKAALSSTGDVTIWDNTKLDKPVFENIRGKWVVQVLPNGLGIFEAGASAPKSVISGDFQVVSNNPLNTINVEGHSYRGTMRFQKKGSSFHIINNLHLKDYVRGVLPYEMPAKNIAILEALKAQAVAARTYAVAHLNQYSKYDFDVYATVKDQMYQGIKAETYASDKATAETEGVVLIYKGNLAKCFYHSTCGGQTGAVHEIWRGSPVPYLSSRIDRDPQGKIYDANTGWKTWTMQWERENLIHILNQFLRSAGVKKHKPFKKLNSISVENRNSCGRVRTLKIVTEHETLTVRSDKTRWALRQPESPHSILPSSWFRFEETGNIISVSGKGLGHGIGMCQTGAMGRAHLGQTFDQILEAYYSGTTLAKIQ